LIYKEQTDFLLPAEDGYQENLLILERQRAAAAARCLFRGTTGFVASWCMSWSQKVKKV